MPRMLPISRQGDFRRIYAQGRRQHLPLLTVVVARPPEPLLAPKAAFVVSRKVAAKAVDRNRLRRRLREAFRSLLPNLRGYPEVIIIARAPATQASFEQLRDTLVELLRRAGLLARPERRSEVTSR